MRERRAAAVVVAVLFVVIVGLVVGGWLDRRDRARRFDDLQEQVEALTAQRDEALADAERVTDAADRLADQIEAEGLRPVVPREQLRGPAGPSGPRGPAGPAATTTGPQTTTTTSRPPTTTRPSSTTTTTRCTISIIERCIAP